MSISVFICSVALLIAVATGAAVNNRPIVGIYTQPSSPEIEKYGEQLVAASYVKYLESAGARVVPIKYTLSAPELKALFNSINGVLFPGGGVDFDPATQYWQTLTSLFKLMLNATEHGDYFPLWGTCMGFQELSIQASGNLSLLTHYDSENYTIPLNFTSAVKTSRLFAGASPDILKTLASSPVTMNNHQWGVSPHDFYADKNLPNFFDILSTNNDRTGKPFISTLEGKKHPVYASQWHPEKVAFEWNIHEVINHSTESVLANQYPASFFVSECRKSQHHFPTVEAETQALIYNYQPVFIYPAENDYEQGYFFNA